MNAFELDNAHQRLRKRKFTGESDLLEFEIPINETALSLDRYNSTVTDISTALYVLWTVYLDWDEDKDICACGGNCGCV